MLDIYILFEYNIHIMNISKNASSNLSISEILKGVKIMGLFDKA